MSEISANPYYINELKTNFSDGVFERVNKNNCMFITNAENIQSSNDFRIFRETQLKRVLRSRIPFVSPNDRNKLSYWNKGLLPHDDAIYKRDIVQKHVYDGTYSIQNLGHATQLIQVPGFNVLTDPVFYGLNKVLYPEKTESYPKIAQLPQIDVIIISHNHLDHVNEISLKKIQHHHETNNWPKPILLVPMGDLKLFESFGFRKIQEMDWFTKVSIAKTTDGSPKTVHFISIPADHRSGRYLIDHHRSLVTGWIINPQQENVIFKYSGDTRPLTDLNQQATDLVLWNEIKHKQFNIGKSNQNIQIPQIICFEPSGPNYTRCDMEITHQSTSYSALLKFIEAKNLAIASNCRNQLEFLDKIKTVMMHHNKFELGPDRFNEGLFIFKKLLKYLELNTEDLEREYKFQRRKLDLNYDRRKLKECIQYLSIVFIGILPEKTSIFVRAKDFIIADIKRITKNFDHIDRQQIRDYLLKGTIFPKIGEKFNNEINSVFSLESVDKYKGNHLEARQISWKPIRINNN